jgi:endo-alpha-1,4-polygalactosaminidase (GH114 family)
VFTSLNWEDTTFSKNDDDTKKYYLDYLSRVAKDKKKVFLLEYTKDPKLAAEARAEAKKLGYTIYISKSLDL